MPGFIRLLIGAQHNTDFYENSLVFKGKMWYNKMIKTNIKGEYSVLQEVFI